MNHQHIPTWQERVSTASATYMDRAAQQAISGEIADCRARIAELEAAALAAQPVKVEPLAELPNDEWEAYARRSELLNESGVAPNPFQAQTAYNAYRAAWNRSYEFNRAALAAVQPVVPQEPVSKWKSGNEFAPYHPSASHVDPQYRDGWNACYYAITAPTAPDAAAVRDKLVHVEDGPPLPEWICRAIYVAWKARAGLDCDYDQFMAKYQGRFLSWDSIGELYRATKSNHFKVNCKELIDAALAASPAATKEPQ